MKKHYGIKYLKLALEVILGTMGLIQPKKLKWYEKLFNWISFGVNVTPKLKELFCNGQELLNEFADLDEIERKELVKYAISLGLNGDVSTKIDAAFDFAAAGCRFYLIMFKK